MKAPEGRKTVKSRWQFRAKKDKDGNIEKFKARIVAKGFTQVKGIDYKETFAPTAKMKSVRSLLAVSAKRRWKVMQDDVPSAYLKSDLVEEIYMELPEGFQILLDAGVDFRKAHDDLLTQHQDNPIIVKLLKTLYGLKQSGREWNNLFRGFLFSEGLPNQTKILASFTGTVKEKPPS